MIASWWASLGGPARWPNSVSGLRLSVTYNSTTYNVVQFGWDNNLDGQPTMFQAPRVINSAQGRAVTDPGFDTGYFYIKDPATGDVLSYGDQINTNGDPSGGAGSTPPWEQLYPRCYFGDLSPVVPASGGGSSRKSAYFKTPFLRRNSGGPVANAVSFWYDKVNILVSTDLELWHYQPWAWWGYPHAVIPAIVMQAGLDVSYIDKDAFDYCYDKEQYLTGAEPFDALDAAYLVYCSRKIGEKVSDLVFEVARHSRDFLFINEAGLLSCESFVSPANSYGSSALKEHLTSPVRWEWSREYLFNRVLASWGSAFRANGDATYTDPSVADFAVSEEPGLESYPGGKWTDDSTNAASVTKFGEIFLGNETKQVVLNGQPRTITRAHFPLVLDTGDHTTGKMQVASHWLTSDSKIRRVLTFTTDLFGLNWGIGDQLTNLAITGDGDTIADCRVIEKTYDFDNWEIETIAIERPSNT